MTFTAPSAISPELPGAPRPSVIRVVVGYPWTKDSDDKVVAPNTDKRWMSIREPVISVARSVKTSVSLRVPSAVPFVIEVARLRGTHGRILLDNLRSRISEADILIMDIGSSDGDSFNYNVLLETGMAISQQAGTLRDLFILKPAKRPAPSDLNGFLFTNYDVTGGDGSIKISDVLGFQAALRSSVLRKAREQGMIGARKGPYAGAEDEDENPPAPSGGAGEGRASSSNKAVKLGKQFGRANS